ncbi:site-specific DNA-methyltransferase [Sessilibacter corallicola]|uniref:site-specific DNA-methyltransferase (adenine-specific) n=2 Tax=Sessilibacter corallicola TaxID=2904075 RepID=A0ABQ0A9X0_9GAMM
MGSEMKKVELEDGQSADIVSENVSKLKELFPDAFSEGGVNFDTLRQLLGDASVLDEGEEKYGLNWHGKKKARQIALTPSTGTLLPCPDESVNWENTQNLFIEGDNLEVLKLLQKSYANKVKMIYIDPPYNTGSEFIYPDKFVEGLETYLRYSGQKNEEGEWEISESGREKTGRKHGNWLSMMYPRLFLAKSLLRQDGVLFVSIDDNEVGNIKGVLNEIFGEENFVGQMVWKKKYIGGKHAKHFVDLHEYVLVYAKNILDLPEILMDRPAAELEKFKLEDEFFDERGKYYTRPLKSNLGLRKTLIYPIEMPDGTIIDTQWMVARETFDQLVKDGRIVFMKKRDGTYNVHRKYYQNDGGGSVKVPSLIDEVSNADGKVEMKSLFQIQEGREIPFDNPKPTEFISYLMKPVLGKNDIVLDFFAGSASTAHTALKLNCSDSGNRKYILVQLPEICPDNSPAREQGYSTISDVAKERLRKVKENLLDGLKMDNLDLGFKVFKLSSSNIRAWNPDRTDLEESLLSHEEHLVEGRSEQDVLYELLLKRGVDLAVPIESREVAGKNIYSIGYGVLFACLDESIAKEQVEDIAQGIIAWYGELAPSSDTHVFFRDSAFRDDVSKTNMAAILEQNGITHVRSL